MKLNNQPKLQRAVLRFSPRAWAKLLYLRDAGESEVCGFGITAEECLLFVEDIVLVRQVCTCVSAELDDGSVADFFDTQVDAGLQPEQFGRIFIHTHPGNSPQPSSTDEETFARVFGRANWAVMFILAKGGQSYARLRYNTGPGIDVEVPVEVDYGQPFEGTDWELWHEEHKTYVHLPPEPVKETKAETRESSAAWDEDDLFHVRWLEPGDRWADYEDFERELIDDYRY